VVYDAFVRGDRYRTLFDYSPEADGCGVAGAGDACESTALTFFGDVGSAGDDLLSDRGVAGALRVTEFVTRLFKEAVCVAGAGFFDAAVFCR